MHSSGASSASLQQRARGRRSNREDNYQRQQRQKQQQFQVRTPRPDFCVIQPLPWSTECTPPAPQIHAWMKRFDLNRSGALEREELFDLLSHLHPEHPPNGKALDLLIEKVPRKPSL